jgi:hypothetical protein
VWWWELDRRKSIGRKPRGAVNRPTGAATVSSKVGQRR